MKYYLIFSFILFSSTLSKFVHSVELNFPMTVASIGDSKLLIEGISKDRFGYSANIAVKHKDKLIKERMFSAYSRSDDEIINYIKERFFVYRDDVYVESSCGGGRVWRCDIMRIYNISGTDITFFGESISLTASEMELYRKKLNLADDTKVYFDIYNELEYKFSSLADSPMITAVLTRTGEKLEINKEYTWSLNKAEYNKNKKIADAAISNKTSPNTADYAQIKKSITFNLVLLKLCNNEAEFQRQLQLIQGFLPADEYLIIEESFLDFKGEIRAEELG